MEALFKVQAAQVDGDCEPKLPALLSESQFQPDAVPRSAGRGRDSTGDCFIAMSTSSSSSSSSSSSTLLTTRDSRRPPSCSRDFSISRLLESDHPPSSLTSCEHPSSTFRVSAAQPLDLRRSRKSEEHTNSELSGRGPWTTDSRVWLEGRLDHKCNKR